MNHAEGLDGDLDFDGTMVTITRLNGRGDLKDGGKSYPLASIGAIDFQVPGAVRAGQVQFSVLGDIAIRKKDTNSLMFSKSQLAEMQAVVDAIRAAQSAPTAATAAPSGNGILEQIDMLSTLHDKGVLTDEEFASKKQTLLERL